MTITISIHQGKLVVYINNIKTALLKPGAKDRTV